MTPEARTVAELEEQLERVRHGWEWRALVCGDAPRPRRRDQEATLPADSLSFGAAMIADGMPPGEHSIFMRRVARRAT